MNWVAKYFDIKKDIYLAWPGAVYKVVKDGVRPSRHNDFHLYDLQCVYSTVDTDTKGAIICNISYTQNDIKTKAIYSLDKAMAKAKAKQLND